jgi:hypothetical protein
MEGILPDGDKFITWENVDLYFVEEVATMLIQPKTARRIVTALQFYNNYVESPGGVETFIVDDSQNVLGSLEIQKRHYMEERRACNSLADPLENLKTNMLSEADKLKFIRTVFQDGFKNWCPLITTFTGCEQTMMRQDSIKKVRWCDLHINDTHAAVENDNHIDGKMLCVVYMPLEHKERQEAKRVVGVWRHTDWEQCWTCSVAMILFYKLNMRELEFDFKHESIGDMPEWYKHKLIPEWSNAKEAGAAYKRVMRRCDISWGKCAHLQKCSLKNVVKKDYTH